MKPLRQGSRFGQLLKEMSPRAKKIAKKHNKKRIRRNYTPYNEEKAR